MEDEVREVLAEASGEAGRTGGESDTSEEENFHDSFQLADNDLTRPSDWRPSSASGTLEVILKISLSLL